MISDLLLSVANHLWQSTLFAAAATVFAFALRKERAQSRYWVWLAASLKFLVPFSVLAGIGAQFQWRTGAPVTLISAPIEQFGQPFTAIPTAPVAPVLSSAWTAVVLFAVWMCGGLVVLVRWGSRWNRLRIAVRRATPLPIDAPIRVLSCPSRIEPGVFGLFRPVLLLPEGILQRLAQPQLEAILAHELCHVQRRDNFWSAVHMVVEAAFWFHPLVWWIGGRLVEERERACDEDVLRMGNDAENYAAGILQVCRFYLESPLPCAAGVTGADLKRRVERIMRHRVLKGMSAAKKVLVGVVGMLAVGAPIFVGMATAQTQPEMKAVLKFEVASVKPSDPDSRGMRLGRSPGNGLMTTGTSLKTLIRFAYDVQDFQITGAPGWISNERYDVVAKPERPEGPDDLKDAPEPQQRQLFDALRERTRSLLAERFHLEAHLKMEERPVYLLVQAKGGHKMRVSQNDAGITRNRGRMQGDGEPMGQFAGVLGMVLGRPVLDRTGLAGKFDFTMEWAEDSPGGKGGSEGEPIPADPDGVSIFTAIQSQLGLKLEAGRGPVAVIVIDRVERPTGN